MNRSLDITIVKIIVIVIENNTYFSIICYNLAKVIFKGNVSVKNTFV
jgi:hypothetical protein